MGINYTSYLLPDRDAMEFRPSAPILESIIKALVDLRWVQAAETYRIVVGNDEGRMSKTHARHDSLQADVTRVISQERGFVVVLPALDQNLSEQPRDDGRTGQYDFEDDDTGIFQARYCDGVDLIWSRRLFAVPEDMDSPVPCPQCSANVLVEFPAHDPMTSGLRYGGVTKTAPTACRDCGVTLTASTLVAGMRSRTGGMIKAELAPFGHFMIALHPAPKASPKLYPHPIDAMLMQALKEATSVSFRHMGRWN